MLPELKTSLCEQWHEQWHEQHVDDKCSNEAEQLAHLFV